MHGCYLSLFLRRELHSALSRNLPGPASAEILRLREDATSPHFELKWRIRADFTRTTMYREYSAFLIFSIWSDDTTDLTSKQGEEHALICIKTVSKGFETCS